MDRSRAGGWISGGSSMGGSSVGRPAARGFGGGRVCTANAKQSSHVKERAPRKAEAIL